MSSSELLTNTASVVNGFRSMQKNDEIEVEMGSPTSSRAVWYGGVVKEMTETGDLIYVKFDDGEWRWVEKTERWRRRLCAS